MVAVSLGPKLSAFPAAAVGAEEKLASWCCCHRCRRRWREIFSGNAPVQPRYYRFAWLTAVVARPNASVVIDVVVAVGGGVCAAVGAVDVGKEPLPTPSSAVIVAEFPEGPHQPSAWVYLRRPQGEGGCRNKGHQQFRKHQQQRELQRLGSIARRPLHFVPPLRAVGQKEDSPSYLSRNDEDDEPVR